MRLWPFARSNHSDPSSSSLPGQWLFYFLTLFGVTVSLIFYIYGIKAHIEHEHAVPIPLPGIISIPNTEIAPRIPVFTASAKHYADDYSATILNARDYAPDAVEQMLFYLVPLLGILILILFFVAIRMIHVASKNLRALNQSNQALQREINERIQAEETKQVLEKALLQGQKLQAIGTLAGGIAHDFNNILYAIMGYTEMAQEDSEKDSQIYENLGKVLEASQRGQELISRILSFGRKQLHHEFKPIPLKATLESVLMLLKPTVPSSVIVEFKGETLNDCLIMGNHTQIHQVIVNLITNAVDAMDGEGTIQIQLQEIEANEHLLAGFSQLHMLNYCKLTITDTGHGMDQSTLERIFEPFFTTKEVGKGTGLGLATVYSIIEEHEGEIFVTSQLGKGTTFTIFIPEYAPK